MTIGQVHLVDRSHCFRLHGGRWRRAFSIYARFQHRLLNFFDSPCKLWTILWWRRRELNSSIALKTSKLLIPLVRVPQIPPF